MTTVRKALVLIGAISLVVGRLYAAPESDLWPKWQAHDPQSSETLDHSPWTDFLSEYLITNTSSGVNLVRYADVSSADEQALRAYIQYLEGIAVSALNRNVQFAYWVNLYNSYTVKLILDHYPVDSIRDINISPGLFNRGPWDAKVVKVEGSEMSLNDIEHRVLRPIWQDPRIHYVVNCASIGCPNLPPTALTGATVEETLSRSADEYINHPRGVSISGNRMTLSSIYRWYTEDFGGTEEGVIEHLLIYAEPSLETRLREFDGRVRYEYDWSLNEP
jgi:hypothetical protein